MRTKENKLKILFFGYNSNLISGPEFLDEYKKITGEKYKGNLDGSFIDLYLKKDGNYQEQ